jgi:hypothetical protein
VIVRGSRVRSLWAAALLCAVVGSVLVVQVGAAPAAARPHKSKCKKRSARAKGGCKHKPKKPSGIVSGIYTGKDSFGEIGIIVGTETSGAHAGQRYVRLSGGNPVSVTCSNGLSGTVVQEGLGYVKGKSFSGTLTTPFSESKISGSFTSSTALKGSFESSQSPFGYTCSTGSQSFTAKLTF